MKKLGTVMLLMLCSRLASGQLYPAEQAELDSLVQLAVQNSWLLEELDKQREQQQLQLGIEKTSWISGVDAGVQFFSMEQQTMQEEGDSFYTGSVLPQVGGSLRLNLHRLVTTPQRIKIARKNVERTRAVTEQQKIEVAKLVTVKYFQYAQAKRQAGTAQQQLDELEQQEALVRERFERQEARLDDFLAMQQALTMARQQLTTQQMNMALHKKELVLMVQPPANEAAPRQTTKANH